MTSADVHLIQDIQKIKNSGCKDENPRPKYADGTEAYTYFITHNMRQYRLNKNEFPICTLRPIAWKSAIREILWIYQDESNSLEMLRNKYNVHYWDEWESKDMPGTIGVRYGETVRRHNLMKNLLEGLCNDPYGRRHIMNLWQEDDFKASDGLLPCCYETIWTVRGEYLDMFLNQRSGDMLAASGAGGINEVQYAALLLMVAKHCGYKPGTFTHIVANEHIYDRHWDAAHELMRRFDGLSYKNEHYTFRFDPAIMEFNPKGTDFYSFTVDDFQLKNYDPVKPQLTLELGI